MDASSKSGLLSLACCSPINMLCLCCRYMNSDSQQSILLPLEHGFSNFSVSSAGPNSCLLSRMCVAYAEVELLFLM